MIYKMIIAAFYNMIGNCLLNINIGSQISFFTEIIQCSPDEDVGLKTIFSYFHHLHVPFINKMTGHITRELIFILFVPDTEAFNPLFDA